MGEKTKAEDFTYRKEIVDSIAKAVVKEALELELSMYEIEKIAANINCLAKFQSMKPIEPKTEHTPLVWNS